MADAMRYVSSSDDDRTVINVKLTCAKGGAEGSNGFALHNTYLSAETTSSVSARRREEASEMRKSCDSCIIRKKRCDGNGTRNCSFCNKKGLACIYNKKIRRDRSQRSSWEQEHKDVGVLRQEQSLKRARLSPSPATGLVGLKENVYIGDFFRVLGFWSFTEESDIRKAIATMFANLHRQAEDDHHGGSLVFSIRPPPEVRAVSCVLWCTVALGYLVQGRPKNLVVEYTNHAEEALSGCFGAGSVETARAFISMAILQNFLGDEMGYRKNFDFAKAIIAAQPPGVVPEELKVTAVHTRVGDTSWLDPGRFDGDCWELKKECTTLKRECSELPDDLLGEAEEKLEKPNIFRRADLYRWLIQLEVRMGHGFHTDMFNVGFYDEIINRRTLTNQNRPQTSISGGNQDRSKSAPLPPLRGTSRKFTANAMKEFNALKSLTEMSEIRGGVGELYVRSIMAYVSRLEGRSAISFESLDRCGEVIIKHPGLCRFTRWKHMTHRILNVLAGKGFKEKYSKLRDVYNSTMDGPGVRKFPRFEDFTSIIDICDGCFCQSIFSDEIVEIPGIGGISNPTREDRIQELCSTEYSFPCTHVSVTPGMLENTKSLSLETPQGGEEQLQHAAPVVHFLPLEGLATAFIGVGAGAA